MCAFYLSDVSRGREPNRRLAFGDCSQTLAFFPCNELFVIASGNQGTPRDTVYPWGKGAHKHKSERYRLR